MTLRSDQRRRVTYSCGNELMTKQSHKAECDINNILSQFKRTGIITHITAQQPIYQDLPDTMDYQESLHVIMNADAAFSTLPSVVRRYFDNDPAKLLAAINDPDMKDKLIELGVLRKPDQPQPAGAPDLNGQPAPASTPAPAPYQPASTSVPPGGTPSLP